MTVVHSFKGYGQHLYGSLPYGGGTAEASSGVQFESLILSVTNPEGVQFESFVEDDKPEGVQFSSLVVDKESPHGVQFEPDQSDTLNTEAVQFLSLVADFENPQGISFFATNLGYTCAGYGQFEYGTRPYSQPECYAAPAVQFDTVGNLQDPQGVQFESVIADYLSNNGLQFDAKFVDFLEAEGLQLQSVVVDSLTEEGVQYSGQIVNKLNNQGIQFEVFFADVEDPEGVQFEAIGVNNQGLQFTVNLYNTNRLRVLCEFPSRGDDDAVGLNAWGRTSGTGNNWIANSQATGDFEDFRLNTDIVEEVWRSETGTVTSVTLDCDTEVSQGVFLDTLAILNHNLTTSAIVTLIGSNSATFAPIGTSRILNVRLNNIYHIEETLPLISYRYWRISINDPTNLSGHLEIGTIVFGSAQLLQGECMIDRILKKSKHFADTVRTEGFTSVKNDRSLKKQISLTFEKLEFNKGNFQTLSEVLETARTSQKCLWIPTPSPTDPSFNERFAVFAKLTEMPEESHQVMGENEGDFIDLTLELSESE